MWMWTPDRTALIRHASGGSVVIDSGPEFHAAVAAGPADYAPPDDTPALAPVPETVSRYQARAALHNAGLLSTVEAAVAAADDELIRIAWADATVFRRDSPTILALAEALGLTSTQLDDLFRAAALIAA